jgi:hypothetical protein
MLNLKNKLQTVTVMLFVTIICSCKQSDNVIEGKIVSDFSLVNSNLNEIIQYVVTNYYTRENTNNYNSLQFVLSEKIYRKGNIFSDTLITNRLRNSAIINISFEKGSLCLDKYGYDFVRFKLRSHGSYQYYYVYEFCPPNQNAVDNPNFKTIPLNSNWSLQVEKT